MSYWKLLTGRWGSGAGETDELRIDASTNTLQVIPQDHHEIHSGHAYTTCRIVTLGAGGSANVLIITPAQTNWAHFIFQVVSDDVMTVNFYEAPDYAGGSAMEAFNRNRNSGNASNLTITSDATDTAGGKGTLIWTFSAGANKTVTTSESARFEFILDQSNKYLLEAVGSLNDNITFLLDWYHHTDKH